MKCPECRNDLVSERLPNVNIDRCASCNGVWFDSGELVSYRRSVEYALESKSGAFLGFKSFGFDSPLRCPKCELSSLERGRVAGGWPAGHCTKCNGYFVTKTVLDTMGKKAEATYQSEKKDRTGPWWELLVRTISKK